MVNKDDTGSLTKKDRSTLFLDRNIYEKMMVLCEERQGFFLLFMPTCSHSLYVMFKDYFVSCCTKAESPTPVDQRGLCLSPKSVFPRYRQAIVWETEKERA